MDTSDRRKSPRLPARVPVMVTVGSHQEHLQTSEIGLRGVFVAADPPRPQRQLVRLTFTLPDGRPFDVQGMVARSVTASEARQSEVPAGMGIQFYGLNPLAMERWESFFAEASAQIEAGLAPLGTEGPIDSAERAALAQAVLTPKQPYRPPPPPRQPPKGTAANDTRRRRSPPQPPPVKPTARFTGPEAFERTLLAPTEQPLGASRPALTTGRADLAELIGEPPRTRETRAPWEEPEPPEELSDVRTNPELFAIVEERDLGGEAALGALHEEPPPRQITPPVTRDLDEGASGSPRRPRGHRFPREEVPTAQLTPPRPSPAGLEPEEDSSPRRVEVPRRQRASDVTAELLNPPADESPGELAQCWPAPVEPNPAQRPRRHFGPVDDSEIATAISPSGELDGTQRPPRRMARSQTAELAQPSPLDWPPVPPRPPQGLAPDNAAGAVVYRLALPDLAALEGFAREALAVSGVFVRTFDVREAGTPAVVCVVHPFNTDEFHLPGEVVSSAGNRPGVAVRFHGVTPRTVDAFRTFVARGISEESASESRPRVHPFFDQDRGGLEAVKPAPKDGTARQPVERENTLDVQLSDLSAFLVEEEDSEVELPNLFPSDDDR